VLESAGGLTDVQDHLMRALARGAVVSGAVLAHELGVSRSAVWKQLRQLAEMGVQVLPVRGQGYRLAAPLELLDRDAILDGLPPELAARLGAFQLPFAIDSTNLELLRQPASAQLRLCLAEFQWAGRGRRGRSWQSPLCGQIPLSLAYTFAALPADFSALGLAVGVMAASALRQLGAPEIGLKWPNDLHWRGRKLGGVLIEVRGETGGPCEVVVGVGINVNLATEALDQVDQPWTDLSRILGATRPHRNRIAQQLIVDLVRGLDVFADQGLAPFLADYAARDVLAGRVVRVEQNGQWREGAALGVDERGALRVRHQDGIRSYWSGEVSVRESQG
jgi:BirA family biotin operon repressor/biotin-[acetyl-CoA-carboxylase] ligase